MKQGLRATEPQAAVSPLVLQAAWTLHVINLVSTWLSLFSGLPHGPPTHQHSLHLQGQAEVQWCAAADRDVVGEVSKPKGAKVVPKQAGLSLLLSLMLY